MGNAHGVTRECVDREKSAVSGTGRSVAVKQ